MGRRQLDEFWPSRRVTLFDEWVAGPRSAASSWSQRRRRAVFSFLPYTIT